jgi:hypothetical protein
MAKIEQRIGKLEAKLDLGKPFIDEIVIQIIRPGDMACVAERRWDSDSKQWTWKQFIDDDEGIPGHDNQNTEQAA